MYDTKLADCLWPGNLVDAEHLLELKGSLKRLTLSEVTELNDGFD